MGSEFREKRCKLSDRGMGSGDGECALHNDCSASLRQHFLSTFCAKLKLPNSSVFAISSNLERSKGWGEGQQAKSKATGL